MENAQTTTKKKLPLLAAIVKITGNNCNLRCEYCFYHSSNQQAYTVINEKLLEKLIKEYIYCSPEKAYFIWHGGEPLIAGYSLFAKIIEIENKYRKPQQVIKNAVQTNGTLLNKNWATFFKNNNFKIGVSLDGSKRSHDLFRKDVSGNGTFDRVIQGIKLLRENGIEPGIISVLTKQGLDNLVEDFNFLVKELFIKSWGINVLYNKETQLFSSKTCEAIDNEDFIKYFKILVDLWLARNDSRLKIREIDGFGATVFNKAANICSYNGSCGNFICVEVDGKVYPCDRFTSGNDFLLGDFNYQSIQSILESEKLLRFRKLAKELPSICRQCQWKNSCHNGCTAMRDSNNNYYYCLGRQKLFDYLKKKMEGIY